MHFISNRTSFCALDFHLYYFLPLTFSCSLSFPLFPSSSISFFFFSSLSILFYLSFSLPFPSLSIPHFSLSSSSPSFSFSTHYALFWCCIRHLPHDSCGHWIGKDSAPMPPSWSPIRASACARSAWKCLRAPSGDTTVGRVAGWAAAPAAAIWSSQLHAATVPPATLEHSFVACLSARAVPAVWLCHLGMMSCHRNSVGYK